MTPRTPRPPAVLATTTSTGFAVAQKMPTTSGTRAQRAEHVDRVEAFGEHEHEAVTCADGQRVLRCQRLHPLVGPRHAHEPVTRSLAEGDAELDARHRVHHRLVDVLDRLDEVRLAQNHAPRSRAWSRRLLRCPCDLLQASLTPVYVPQARAHVPIPCRRQNSSTTSSIVGADVSVTRYVTRTTGCRTSINRPKSMGVPNRDERRTGSR